LKTSGWPTVEAKEDNFNMIYSDLADGGVVKMNGHTSMVEINSKRQIFFSEISSKYFRGSRYFKGL